LMRDYSKHRVSCRASKIAERLIGRAMHGRWSNECPCWRIFKANWPSKERPMKLLKRVYRKAKKNPQSRSQTFRVSLILPSKQ